MDIEFTTPLYLGWGWQIVPLLGERVDCDAGRFVAPVGGAAALSASTPSPCQRNHIHLQTTTTAQINTYSRQNRNLPKGVE